MSMSDPIADMLTRIRNACMASHKTVEIPHSNRKTELARVLKKEGFIRDYTTEGHEGKRTLRLYLKYAAEGRPVIQGLQRVSRPGLRHYVPADGVERVLGGIGVAVLTTSRGLVTDEEARRAHIGGEVMCHVW